MYKGIGTEYIIHVQCNMYINSSWYCIPSNRPIPLFHTILALECAQFPAIQTMSLATQLVPPHWTTLDNTAPIAGQWCTACRPPIHVKGALFTQRAPLPEQDSRHMRECKLPILEQTVSCPLAKHSALEPRHTHMYCREVPQQLVR